MQINTTFSKEEYQHIKSRRSRLRKATNENKILIDRTIFAKTDRDVKNLKELKKAYKQKQK